MRFALFGPLGLVDDSGSRVTFPGARQRSLLACLLLHANSPVSRDVLIEAVWGGGCEAGSVTMLRSVVMRLRREMGAELASRIKAQEPGYLVCLETPELDALEFEALCHEASAALRVGRWEAAAHAGAEALALCRDEPLLDVASPLLREKFVPRLEQLRLQAFEDRMEAVLNLGGQEELIPELRELVAAHPLRERFHAQLMIALAKAGRQAEALEAYRDARRALVGELGVEPGPELRFIQERILVGDYLAPPIVTPLGPSQVIARSPSRLPSKAKRRHVRYVRAFRVPSPIVTSGSAEESTRVAVTERPPSPAHAMREFIASGHGEPLVQAVRRLHHRQLKACHAATSGLMQGYERLSSVTEAFLESCRRERGMCRLLASSGPGDLVAAEVYRRNRQISELLRLDFKALGYRHPAHAAWVWVVMMANVADTEIATDDHLPALGSTLAEYLTMRSQRAAVR